MLEIIRPHTTIDFVGKRGFALALSATLMALSGLLIAFVGPRWGIDFTGGLLVHVRSDPTVGAAAIRAAFADDPIDVALQDAGAGEFLLRFGGADAAFESDVRRRLDEALDRRYEILRIDLVGPRVGADLRRQAIMAVLAATVVMGAYVAWRFEPRFGLGAAVALVHDVVLTIGALVLCGYEIDLTTIAALLTVVGFSVNDTVIVSDRVRENQRKYPRLSLAARVNQSINETLSRTVLTSGTALLVVLALFSVGGRVIHGFAFTLLVGLSVGTYSSIFIAIPLVLGPHRRPS